MGEDERLRGAPAQNAVAYDIPRLGRETWARDHRTQPSLAERPRHRLGGGQSSQPVLQEQEGGWQIEKHHLLSQPLKF